MEHGRTIGEGGKYEDDGGRSEQPNGPSEEVGEGVRSCDPSDFESMSDDGDLSTGTMSRSHWSSSCEGHLGMGILRRKTLFREER